MNRMPRTLPAAQREIDNLRQQLERAAEEKSNLTYLRDKIADEVMRLNGDVIFPLKARVDNLETALADANKTIAAQKYEDGVIVRLRLDALEHERTRAELRKARDRIVSLEAANTKQMLEFAGLLTELGNARVKISALREHLAHERCVTSRSMTALPYPEEALY